MTKMEGIAAEVSQKLKSAIKAKLTELGAYVDDELSNYVMVMVTNRRSKTDMDRELQLFLGANTTAFTSWLQTVWQKLEQVTITNSNIDGKRKTTDKKKKPKKSSKTSSDSEDERKHKKKRKSSVGDSVCKDAKKKKFQPRETEIKKKDGESHTRVESDSESDDQDENNKKLSKDAESANEEEDFLNIKEDFESEFLSDNEGSTSATKSKIVLATEAKKSQKTDMDTTSKMISLKRPEDTVTAKESTDKVKSSPEVANFPKSFESSRESKPPTTRKSLTHDYKTKLPIKLKARRRSPSPSNKSRSRSKSPSHKKIIKLKRRASGSVSEEEEDFKTKIQRSRLKSVSANASSLKVSKKSRSRSRSPLTSATAKKQRYNREADGVLDARELINRKRAMCIVNEPVTKERNELGVAKTTVTGGKIVRIRDRESSKENCRTDDEDCVTEVDDVWPENDDLTDENRKSTIKINKNGTSSNVVTNRNDGKRSVIVHSSTSTNSSPNNRRVDLRGIKRTVYIDEEDTIKRDHDVGDANVPVETVPVDEKPEKKKKINVDHLLKYIQSDKVVASTVVKLPKPPRPKTSPAQAASSTLIRKAMADAHKSLTSVKDKKGAPVDSKTGRQKYHEKTTVHPEEVIDDDIEPNRDSDVAEDHERLSIKSTGSGDDRMNCNYNEHENIDERVEQNEYEPSMSVPQFVVTLTGLDSNSFPKVDADDPVDLLNDDLEPDMADMEENKNKLKNQERCKYYPNCLVGDQCLYYHPTIPCKLFPNCKFGSNCLYIHPKCKFDSMCTRYDCTFMHSVPRTVQSAPPRHVPPSSMITTQPCKFYYNCVNPVCPFQHPKICRFDRFCTNKNCTFSHTSLTHVSTVSKDKLKWSRPRDSDLKMQPDNETST